MRLYNTSELLFMPGVRIEHWKGAADRVAQCHRCQAFGHSSANCHRPQQCVRCGGQHFAADCPRPIVDKPTCAICGRDHTANNRLCPVFRREARKRGVRVPPPFPPAPAPATANVARGRAVSPPPRSDRRSAAPSRQPAAVRSRPTAPHAARPVPVPAVVTYRPSVRADVEVQAEANGPTERGAPLPSRGKRNRRGGKKRRKPVASSTPRSPDAAPTCPTC